MVVTPDRVVYELPRMKLRKWLELLGKSAGNEQSIMFSGSPVNVE